jgi:hypothetical protein
MLRSAEMTYAYAGSAVDVAALIDGITVAREEQAPAPTARCWRLPKCRAWHSHLCPRHRRSKVTAATVVHLLFNTQQATHKCSLAGKLLPDGGRVADLGRPVLLRIVERRVVAVSLRARAAMLGLLVFAHNAVATVRMRQHANGTTLAEELMAARNITVGGRNLWDYTLIRQLAVGVDTAHDPNPDVAELHEQVPYA